MEVQAKWLAGVLAGQVALPDNAGMQREVQAHQRELAKTYVGSARYTLEVDAATYKKQLFSDLRSGQAGG